MPCEYDSYSVFETFTDRATLDKALAKVQTEKGFSRTGYRVYQDRSGRLQVEASTVAMNALKQAYQVEVARAALKKKGFFVTEKKAEDGKVTLTVRA
jgi:hypothetical protein